MKVSVVIPTLNEGAYLSETLKNLKRQDPPPHEIIVVDAGSRDCTQEIATTESCRLIQAERSISKQMNAGALHAHGSLLLFLHADCRLEQNAFAELPQCMSSSKVVGGAFQLQLCGNRPILDHFLSWSGRCNARHSQVYLGDHGIFCRRSVFFEIGGFPDVQLMYEFEFMRKLRKQGQLIQLNKRCFASARRFQKEGYWKTILLMRSLRTFYWLGLPTGPLEQIYLSQENGEYFSV